MAPRQGRMALRLGGAVLEKKRVERLARERERERRTSSSEQGEVGRDQFNTLAKVRLVDG